MHYLICFPRSGSSYVCNVVEKSTEHLARRCLARPLQPFNLARAEQVVLLKSHALSPISLLRTLLTFDARQYGIDLLRPDRVLVLWRDPRDTLISYYEYLSVRVGQRLDQREFLVGPAPTWADDEGTVGQKGLRIVDRYRGFVRGWIHRRDEAVLHLHFEDLVEAPEHHFRRFFRFLDIEQAPNPSLFRQRVNLVSEDDRPRASVGGWQAVGEQYTGLLATIESELGPELELLRSRRETDGQGESFSYS